MPPFANKPTQKQLLESQYVLDGGTIKTKTGTTESKDKSTNTNTTESLNTATYQATEQAVTNLNLSSATDDRINKYVHNFAVKSLYGIEGIPYQFLPTVDRRIVNKDSDSKTSNESLEKSSVNDLGLLGRKYSEKIVTQIPLLFVAPCNPAFMDDKGWNDSDISTVASAFLEDIPNLGSLLTGKGGRLYAAEYAYNQYYNYLNAMLLCVATYLGIGKEQITLGGETKPTEIRYANWMNEADPGFTDAWLAKQNLMFYMDSIDTISETFQNVTAPSQIASLVNGFSEQAREIDYLFGTSGNNVISSLKQSSTSAIAAISETLSGPAMNLGGSVVGSLANGGIESIIDGGKIVFPEMWSDSEYSKSYTISIKLRSPDNDSLSIFLNVLKPYCKWLCMVLPHMYKNNVNTYRTPFICKAYSKGLFNIDLGMVTGLSVSKGATCCWNDDGLPTQIDLDIDIKDLYSQLSMTGYEDDSLQSMGFIQSTWKAATQSFSQTYNIVNNTSYQDFLANMAGLNINEAAITRKAIMYYDLFANRAVNFLDEGVAGRANTKITNIINKAYSWW